MTPEGWRNVRFRELAPSEGFFDGDWIESKDQDPSGSVRLLQVGNVLRGRLKLGGAERWVTPETVSRLKCTLLERGDLLVARMPDPIGRACIVPSLPYPAITAVDCAILRVDPSVSCAEFVVQICNSDGHLAEVARRISGTTRQRVSRSALGDMKIVLPPLWEQKKIAAILTAVDEAIEATQAVIDQLQVVKSALMSELLTRGLPGRHSEHEPTAAGGIPKGWALWRGRDLFTLGGGHGPAEIDFSADGDSAFMKVDTFNTDGNQRYIRNPFARFHAAKNPRVKCYPAGCLVFAKRGAAIEKNRVGMLSESTAVDPNLMVLATAERLRPAFFRFQLQHLNLSSLADNSGIPQINNHHLYPALFIVPPIEEQTAIESVLLSVEDAILENVTQRDAVVMLKSTMAATLLSGQVRVSENR